MPTHPVYDMLLSQVTDDLERKVLSALIEAAGERVSRETLVLKVFGIYVNKHNLAGSPEDRKIRESIERLQHKDYPIMASSGEPGYMLAADEAELDAYIGEIISRQNQLKEKETALRRSRRWIKFIREYRTSKPPVQIGLFGGGK